MPRLILAGPSSLADKCTDVKITLNKCREEHYSSLGLLNASLMFVCLFVCLFGCLFGCLFFILLSSWSSGIVRVNDTMKPIDTF